MEQFFQSYGSWLLFGVLFLAMFAMHGLGMGHGNHGQASDLRKDPAANQGKDEGKEEPPACH